MSTRMKQFAVFTIVMVALSFSGCRAGQGLFPQQGLAPGQPVFGQQLGQRIGNIALNRGINAGITRPVSYTHLTLPTIYSV